MKSIIEEQINELSYYITQSLEDFEELTPKTVRRYNNLIKEYNEE